MSKFLFLSIVLLVSLNVSAQQKISFISEYIDFTIDEDYFSMNGIYNLINNTDQPINKKLSFPFTVKTSLIDSIKIMNLNNLQLVPFKKEDKQIGFYLFISPDDTLHINIFYRQNIEHKNIYILQSTKSWEKPLEEAIFTLTVLDNIRIESFSIEPDSSKTGIDNMIYYWSKYNFMPEVDLEIIIDE